MDLSAALHIRQLGYTVRFSTLLDSSLQETAEDTLMKLDFSSKVCDFKNPTKSVFILSTSPDGRHVASGHGDHSIYVSEVATGKVVHCLTGHRRTPWTIAYHSRRNDLLASGCLAGEVRVWDLKTGYSECLRTDDNTAIASVAFHPSEQYLAVATADKVLLWDWNQSYPFAVCQTSTSRERLRYVRFDPTGYILFTGITNQREALEPTRFIVTPPEIMPSRFREMLTSRNELLQMRAELSRSHQRMLQRYNELQMRYNRLREQYPDLVGASQRWDSNNGASASLSTTGPSESEFSVSASPPLHWLPRPVAPPELSPNENNNTVPSAYANSLNFAVNSAGPSTERFPLPRPESSAANEEYYDGSYVRNVTVGGPANYGRIPYVRLDSADEGISIRRSFGYRTPEHVENSPMNDEPSSSTASTDYSQPPLSPIALEGLQDAVAYAREITTRSMDQFVRRHHDSIARLQQSYRQISEQAQNLMQQFSQTLDDMQKLQEMIDKKYPPSCDEHSSADRLASTSCSTDDESGQHCTAYALLNALSRMRKVLEQPNEPDVPSFVRNTGLFGNFTLENQQRLQMENEVNRLMKVHEIISEFDCTMPMNSTTKVYLNHHRIVLNDISRDITNASDIQTLTFIRARLTEEIKEFQNFIQRWKQDIMAKIRSNNGFRSIAVTKTDAQAQTSPLTLENDDQPGPSTSGYGAASSIVSSESTSVSQSAIVSSVSSKRTVNDTVSNGANDIVPTDSQSESTTNQAVTSPDIKRRKLCPCLPKESDARACLYQSNVPIVSSTNEMETESSTEVHAQQSKPAAAAATATAATASIPEDVRQSVREISINLRRVDDEQIPPLTNVAAAAGRARSTARMSTSGPRSHVSISSAVETAMRRRHRLFGSSRTGLVPSVNDGAEPELRVWRVGQSNDALGGGLDRRIIYDTAQDLSVPELTVRRVRQAAERLNDVERRVVAAGLPETTVQRVRQAAERLNELERRADVLTAQVSSLSRRAAVAERAENMLLTQTELLERREARLRPVRALRDLSVDNLAAREFAVLRRLIGEAADASQRVIGAASPDAPPPPPPPQAEGVDRQVNFFNIDPQRRESPTRYLNVNLNVPWHRRRYAAPFVNNNNNVNDEPLNAAADSSSSSSSVWTLGRPTLPDFEQPTRRRAYVILNRTVNAPVPPVAWEDMEAEDRVSSFDLHRSVNRAIAGAFIGTGDVAVANNILDTTCRIQFWNIKRNQPPDISQSSMNVILGRCKLNNDGSVSISEDGRLLAAFVENDREDKSLWAHTILKIVSLRPEDRGLVLYQKTFAPNAISVSISPAMGHVLIGLASRRYLRLRHSPQTFAQVYRMCDCKDNPDKPRELKLTMNIEHRSVEMPLEDIFAVRNESLNCAVWLKTPGHGICYGTNKGQLLVLSGKENVVERRNGEREKVDEHERSSSIGTMRVLLRRNGRLNMADARRDEPNSYRTVIV